MSSYLLFPLFGAIIYAVGSILVKRALKEGAAMEQTFHYANLCIALVFAPVMFLETAEVNWAELWKPILVALVFFLGNLTTFIAIKNGDVSLVTPLMGTKVVFVAIAAVFLTNEVPSNALWIAAGLTAVGIFLMGWSDFRKSAKAGSLRSIGIILLSSVLFALQDVLMAAWAKPFGAMTFLSLEMWMLLLFSLIMWLCQGRPSLKMPKPSRKFGMTGGLMIGIQALLLGIVLSFYNNTTGINIVFASRGLWVIAAVGLLGSFFGNDERKTSGGAFIWRIVGTLLLTVAVVIAVLDKS